MMAGSTAKPAPRHIRAPGLRFLGHLRCGRGNVSDALMRGLRPKPAMKVLLLLRIKMVIRQRIPATVRSMIKPHSRHLVIVGIDMAGTGRQRLGTVGSATGHGPGG